MTASRPRISATIIALNEEMNIPRCLRSLQWVDEIIVVDSNSTDATREIAEKYGAKVFNESWQGYGAQKNLAASFTTSDWILNVDADEEITADLKEEIIREISSDKPAAGYAIARKTFFSSQWIRHGGWYPNYVIRLCQKRQGRWSEPDVHEELQIQGVLKRLKNPMNHYTFANIEEQVLTNVRYAKQGARALASKGQKPSLIKLIFKPLGKFLETYILKRGFLDGLHGFIISINAAHSMFMKFAFLFHQKPTRDVVTGETDP